MATPAKQKKTDSTLQTTKPGYDTTFKELFGNEDSDEEFLGFDEDNFSDDDEDLGDIDMEKWKIGPRETENITIPPFTGQPGIRAKLPNNASFKDYYNLFMSADVIEMITAETNR